MFIPFFFVWYNWTFWTPIKREKAGVFEF